MRLVAHEIGAPLKMVPASGSREWMDNSSSRFAYRCIPLSFANGSGWELLSPCDFEATWNGGSRIEDIEINALDGYPTLERHACSHFGGGVLTFHPGYLFKTEPGWGVIARGSPNAPKDGIHALEGLIETDWLPFTFTMNWIFTRIGSVTFKKDEPLCFITPVPQLLLEQIQPEIVKLADAPELLAEYTQWSTMRNEFNAGLKRGDPDIKKQGWQRHYVRGTTPLGGEAGETHRSKRKLKAPIRVESVKPIVASPLPMMVESPSITPEMSEALKCCPMNGMMKQKMF